MNVKDCLDIISECVTDGLKVKFDYLTSSDKYQVQTTCDEIVSAIEWVVNLARSENE